MRVAAPPHLSSAIKNFLGPELQYDIRMSADKNPGGCQFTKHGIEDRPVPPVLDWIEPYEDPVNVHKLFTNVSAKIIVINRGLSIDPVSRKSSEQIRKPIIFARCLPSCVVVARVQNGDSSELILRHRDRSSYY